MFPIDLRSQAWKIKYIIKFYLIFKFLIKQLKKSVVYT